MQIRTSALNLLCANPEELGIFFAFNENIVEQLENSLFGNKFLTYWNAAGNIFNVTSGIEQLCNNKWPLFILIKTYWEQMSETEKDIFSETERESIQQIIDVINSELITE